MKQKDTRYTAPEGSEHMRDEELRWLEIVSDPDPVRGMLLVFIQKLCSAFHELAPAIQQGALKSKALPYVTGRLTSRADSVIERLRLNGLLSLDGAQELIDLRNRLTVAKTPALVVEMSEEVHEINHRLCDALASGQGFAQPSALSLLRSTTKSSKVAESGQAKDEPAARDAAAASPETGGPQSGDQRNEESPQEKRRHPRMPLDVTVNYATNAIARMKDMSVGGVGLISDKQLVPGVMISLLFHLPDGVEIEAFGKVQWSTPATEHLWENGVEFSDIAPDHKKAIQQYYLSH